MFGIKKALKKGKYQTFLEKGDVITFGSYRDVGLEWIVLEVKGEEVLLLSMYVLMQRCYSMENYLFKGQYDTKNLVDWLEMDFVKESFPETEELIPVIREDGREKKAFLLTEEEVMNYLHTDEERIAYLNGLRNRRGYDKPCWWWTATKGKLKNTLDFVDKDGKIGTERFQDNQKGGVRPAIRLSVQTAEKTAVKADEAKARYKEDLLNLLRSEKAKEIEKEEAERLKAQEISKMKEQKKADYADCYSAKDHFDLGERLLEMAEALDDLGAEGVCATALLSYKFSHKAGYREATEKLAYLYENGIGCKKSDTVADAYRKLLEGTNE